MERGTRTPWGRARGVRGQPWSAGRGPVHGPGRGRGVPLLPANLFYRLIDLGSARHLLTVPGLSFARKGTNTSYGMRRAVLGSLIHGFTIPPRWRWRCAGGATGGVSLRGFAGRPGGSPASLAWWSLCSSSAGSAFYSEEGLRLVAPASEYPPCVVPWTPAAYNGPGEAVDLIALEERLGIAFRDRGLLEQALMHSSYAHEQGRGPLGSNERLEFLGDAFLDFAVALLLYRRYPEAPEGHLTLMRSALVSQEGLARVARGLGLGAFLRLGYGEEVTGGRERSRNLASALEAVAGALVLDQGCETALAWVEQVFGPLVERFAQEGVPTDPKTLLQQTAQRKGLPPPRYRTVEVVGPSHAPWFTVEVLVGEEVLGRGEGPRKTEAERLAAHRALSALGETPEEV